MLTNRIKYDFQYFTIENYERIIKLAHNRGFKFCFFDDPDIDEGDMKLLWRHDVEFSPDIALQMARIEAKVGVKSTYFFQIHSEFYNVFEAHNRDIVNEIVALGHCIGLHFDSHFYQVASQKELDRFILLDRGYLEKVFGVTIKVFSFHNTTEFILRCEDLQYGGLVNVYSHYFKTCYQYCADSTGYWRYEVLDEVLQNPDTKRLQVLIHDAMWSTEVLSPRKRVQKSIREHAERILKYYDDALQKFGAKNIDD